MKPLSVCMFSNLYPPVVSGSSTQTAALSRELVKRGHQVVVITVKTAEHNEDREDVDGIVVYRLPAIRLPRMRISFNFPWLSYTFTPGNLRRVREIVGRHQPDVIHLHNHMFDLALIAVVMRSQTKRPLVVTIHTMVKHALARYNALLFPFDRILLRYFVIHQSDMIVSPDVNTQRYVADAFGRTDSIIVPYGIELPATPVDGTADSIRSRYDLNGRRVIISLGHLNDNRNRKELIEAMPHVLHQIPNVVLLVVGGIATQEPARWVKHLGLEKSVIFTGHVPHWQVPAFLELADIEAHWLNQDSMENTSLGIASLEAMLAGKVVVAAANEMTYGAGVLKNGENVILVTPGNTQRLAETITELLEDKERCAEIGGRARQTIMEHFSWDSICARTVQVYEEAIRKRMQL